jgi:hypothetical protein
MAAVLRPGVIRIASESSAWLDARNATGLKTNISQHVAFPFKKTFGVLGVKRKNKTSVHTSKPK